MVSTYQLRIKHTTCIFVISEIYDVAMICNHTRMQYNGVLDLFVRV